MTRIKMETLSFWEYLEISLSFLMVGVINLLAFFLPLKYGTRKLSKMENF
jgi:hypothetical protein